jgi:hypothetical protein
VDFESGKATMDEAEIKAALATAWKELPEAIQHTYGTMDAFIETFLGDVKIAVEQYN